MSRMLLQAEGLRFGFGERDLLANAGLSLHAGTRTALLGRNGTGKTTLLRVLAGAQPAEGTVWRRPGIRLAYLGQHHHFAAGETVAQALAAANPYRALYAEAGALSAQLDQPAALARWSEVQDALQRARAAAWPARLGRILAALGLGRVAQGDWAAREAATLSGGERTRLALALTLAREPDLLLLDEPTNHLDIRMREWLEGWLRATFHAGGAGAVLLTSHDRDFLDAVAGRSLWLAGGELREYAGGYTRAAEQRALERRTLRRAAGLGETERGRLGHSAGRLNAWGTSARAVQSRRRRVAVPEAPAAERQLRMRLLAGDARAQLLAWGQHLSVFYGGQAVLRGVRFRLRRGDRVALLGANGTGKSTLLRLLAGELRAGGGTPAPELPKSKLPKPELHFAAGASVAYLDQTWHGLAPQQSLLAQFQARFGDRAPALLGQAGFGAADWERWPSILSGGERARAGLALVSGLRADILLLDEPTNHLDVQALAGLEAAVQAYGGALVMVTHDRRLARTVATRLWLLEGGKLREVDRWNGSHYTDPARALDTDPPPEPPAPTPLERLEALEDEVLALQARLDEAQAGHTPLTGREEARVFSALHALQPQLWEAYAGVFSAPTFDMQVPEPVEGMGGVWVRGLRLGEKGAGGVFWPVAQGQLQGEKVQGAAATTSPFDGPHLAWDGTTLRPAHMPNSPALARALLGGALRILFEHWQVGRVRSGAGPLLSRREWFERLGLAKT